MKTSFVKYDVECMFLLLRRSIQPLSSGWQRQRGYGQGNVTCHFHSHEIRAQYLQHAPSKAEKNITNKTNYQQSAFKKSLKCCKVRHLNIRIICPEKQHQLQPAVLQINCNKARRKLQRWQKTSKVSVGYFVYNMR